MAENVRIYAGTQDGVVVWRSKRGNWEEVSQTFEGEIIDSFSGCRNQPERVFVGVTHDGLYRTDDGGKKWIKVLQGDVRSVTVDPADDRVIYAGLEPVQLYRSEDGGNTWEMNSSLLTYAISSEIRFFQTFILPREEHSEGVKERWWFPLSPHLAHITHIHVHPYDSKVIYLSIEHGGVIRSLDRGKSWESVSAGIDYLDIHMIQNLPNSFERYYVSSARGFFTSSDPLKGWKRVENGITRDYFHSFVFLPPSQEKGNPTMIIASANQSPGAWKREKRGPSAAIFRSQDCAESWQQLFRGLPDMEQTMVWALELHPHDRNAVFAGLGKVSRGYALPLPHYPKSGGKGVILVTRDRGESWENLKVNLPPDRVLFVAEDQ